MAHYTLTPPESFWRWRCVRATPSSPKRRALLLCAARSRRPVSPTRAAACWRWRKTGWRAASPAWRKTPMSPRRGARPDRGGRADRDELPEFAPLPSPQPDFAPSLLNRRADASRARLGARVAAANFPPLCWTASPARAKPKSISRRWPKRCAAEQAGADPVAGDRADGAVPGTLCRAFRLRAGGMAQRSVAEGTPARLSRGDEAAKRAWWWARARRCSCPLPSWAW